MATFEETDLDKGGIAEEALRLYFQQLGAFVIRGIKVKAGRDYVTDIDLWIYTRASVHARHISIVDIKNKKRAKGYERLIWLKGLQLAVNADEAIVATTASKEELHPFAKRLKLRLLSAQVFKAVISRFNTLTDRISSEDLEKMWRPIKDRNGYSLASRMEDNLLEVGLGLSFSSLNVWIDEASDLLLYSYDHERSPGPIARAALLCASLIAIAADYVAKDTAFDDAENRHSYFRKGLIFGNAADITEAGYLNFAENVVTDFVDKTGASASKIRHEFQRSVKELPIAPFADFFSRPTAGRELIDAANQLEAAAFSKNEPNFSQLPVGAKTIVGLIIDYAGLDRRRFLTPNNKVEFSGTDQNSHKENKNFVNQSDGRQQSKKPKSSSNRHKGSLL